MDQRCQEDNNDLSLSQLVESVLHPVRAVPKPEMIFPRIARALRKWIEYDKLIVDILASASLTESFRFSVTSNGDAFTVRPVILPVTDCLERFFATSDSMTPFRVTDLSVYCEEHLASGISVPVKWNGSIVGILTIGAIREGWKPPGDRRLVTELTACLAPVLKTFSADVKKRKRSERTLEALLIALDYRDTETLGHSMRVVEYFVEIGKKLGVSDQELSKLVWGARLHDIGKLAIPDSILLKPGPLTAEEWVKIKRHPLLGFRLLMGIPMLESSIGIVLYHHERYDGKGYPTGLAGEQIPLSARMFAVADSFDAMTNRRPYNEPVSIAEARERIESESGSQFCPRCVEAFLSIPERKLEEIHNSKRLPLDLIATAFF